MPTRLDAEFNAKLMELYAAGVPTVPRQIYCDYDPELRCEHGNHFDPTNQEKIFDEATVFTKTNEYRVKCEIFSRNTIGNCKCVAQPDTHKFLLWNIGGGRLICYAFLFTVTFEYKSGFLINSQIQARNNLFRMLMNENSQLSAKDLTRAFPGFCKRMVFEDETFLCDSCGSTPQYLVMPKAVERSHITELQVDDPLLCCWPG